jgi:hypothetical protein
MTTNDINLDQGKESVLQATNKWAAVQEHL